MGEHRLSDFRDRRDGDLNRFYSREHVGDLIAENLPFRDIRTVIDLGSGSGSLSAAIARRFGAVSFVTVDVDPTCRDVLVRNLYRAGAHAHDHHVHDVFDPDLVEVVGSAGEYDLAVCNPPFFRPSWRREFARILHGAGLSSACPVTADVTAEIVFLAQNIRLVRTGGIVALIVPDGFVTGTRCKPLRKALLEGHSIETVIQLPAHAFRDTDARCFVVFLRKGVAQAASIQLMKYAPDSGLSEPISIAPQAAAARLDYDFHAAEGGAFVQTTTLRSLGADIRRGSLTTIQGRRATYPVFHTTDYRLCPSGALALGCGEIPKQEGRLIVASEGDILIARVDRRLHEKVCIVISGEAALTDCVYRVRLPMKVRKLALAALRSEAGANQLRATSKGVSARLLGKADLLDLPLPLVAGSIPD